MGIQFWVLLIGFILGLVAVVVSRMIASDTEYNIGSLERGIGFAGFAIGMVAVLVMSFPASNIGERWAKDNQLTFNEYLNGYETEAVQLVQPCNRDGGCKHHYDCDPYQEAHTSTDSKGNSTTYYTTEYHSCPYATEEWDFIVKTSLGKDYTIAAGNFPDSPRAFRGDRGVPGDVPRGAPTFWKAAKERIDSGNPGPTTQLGTYKNYILASQNSILKQYSGAMEDLKGKNLLPKLATAEKDGKVRPPYLGSKAYFVRSIAAEDAWTDNVNRLASALGTDLQGDLHVVFVDQSVDAAQYKGALNAYWTGPEFEKNGLSKNGVVIIIGTDGAKATWVRAFTGMPGGNEAMVQSLESGLKGLPLDPATFLGTPKGIVNPQKKVKEIAHSNGKVESILWGPNKFQRVCMVCEGAGDSGVGFTYLDGEVEPTGGQVAIVVFLAGLLIAFLWAGVAWLQIPDPSLDGLNRKGNK